MSELTVRVLRELRADGAKVLTIAFCNETQETLSNVPYSVKITDKKDIVHKDFNEVIDSLSPDEYYYVEIDERDFVEPFSQYLIAITVHDVVQQYAISLYFLDPIVDGKVKKTVPHLAQFFKRYTVFSCVALFALVSFIFFVPYRPVTPEMSRNFLYYHRFLTLFFTFYFVPVAVTLISFAVPYFLERMQPSGRQITGTVSASGQANLRLHEKGATFKFNFTAKMLRNIFIYAFYVNLLLLAYIGLHGVSPIPRLGYDVFSAIGGVFSQQLPFVATDHANLNKVMLFAEYALILLLPIVIFKLMNKAPRIVKGITSVFWGLSIGLLLTLIPFTLSKFLTWVIA
ncbi:MAG TPA: hypothetical protein PK542_09490 [Treponemataceae bacterium]|nr:hypothetical protein [Treponemataceae bacterium]